MSDTRTVEDRYEIGKDGVMITTESDQHRATKIAFALGIGAEMFDRMAHKGAPELWRVTTERTMTVMRYKV